jgi:two-component sensor histidine kinase
MATCPAAASSNEEVKGALSRVEDLLHRFADVHRALQMPECDTPVDAAAYLRQLCRSISRSQLDDRQIELVLAAQPLQLSVDHCWRLGMIVFELINNAARHAFPGGEGEIRVELLRAGPFAKCSVTDNGSAAPTVRPGRGLKIIDELSKSLGGRCIRKFEPRGSWSILAFPCHSELTVTMERPRRVVRISERAPQQPKHGALLMPAGAILSSRCAPTKRRGQKPGATSHQSVRSDLRRDRLSGIGGIRDGRDYSRRWWPECGPLRADSDRLRLRSADCGSDPRCRGELTGARDFSNKE